MASEKVRPDTESPAPSTRDARALLTLALSAAEAAAKVIRAAEPRRATLNWQEKGATDFVTEVDINAESAALEILRRAEPNAEMVAEESAPSVSVPAQVPGSPRSVPLQFVLDPLDGTTNFLHGLPEYAVSLGVVVDGALAAGVVLNVPRNECFTAYAGGGAWLGATRIGVSTITTPQRALIGTGFPFKTPHEIPQYLPQFERIMRVTAGVRRPGAASIDLASVAAGRFDGFWELSLAAWDVAAGILLVREAGGICTDPLGNASRAVAGPIVAGNPAMHAWLLSVLAE